ncbi:MAG: hypothetical protein PHV30_08260, partial [Candidatus Margulisbacteria bacterium]|nr:hypothetical protein [Candidatus Margulisiibacteriota bacterium]
MNIQTYGFQASGEKLKVDLEKSSGSVILPENDAKQLAQAMTALLSSSGYVSGEDAPGLLDTLGNLYYSGNYSKLTEKLDIRQAYGLVQKTLHDYLDRHEHRVNRDIKHYFRISETTANIDICKKLIKMSLALLILNSGKGSLQYKLGGVENLIRSKNDRLGLNLVNSELKKSYSQLVNERETYEQLKTSGLIASLQTELGPWQQGLNSIKQTERDIQNLEGSKAAIKEIKNKLQKSNVSIEELSKDLKNLKISGQTDDLNILNSAYKFQEICKNSEYILNLDMDRDTESFSEEELIKIIEELKKFKSILKNECGQFLQWAVAKNIEFQFKKELLEAINNNTFKGKHVLMAVIAFKELKSKTDAVQKETIENLKKNLSALDFDSKIKELQKTRQNLIENYGNAEELNKVKQLLEKFPDLSKTNIQAFINNLNSFTFKSATSLKIINEIKNVAAKIYEQEKKINSAISAGHLYAIHESLTELSRIHPNQEEIKSRIADLEKDLHSVLTAYDRKQTTVNLSSPDISEQLKTAIQQKLEARKNKDETLGKVNRDIAEIQKNPEDVRAIVKFAKSYRIKLKVADLLDPSKTVLEGLGNLKTNIEQNKYDPEFVLLQKMVNKKPISEAEAQQFQIFKGNSPAEPQRAVQNQVIVDKPQKKAGESVTPYITQIPEEQVMAPPHPAIDTKKQAAEEARQKAEKLAEQNKQAEIIKKKEFETGLTTKINSLISEEKFNPALELLKSSQTKVSENFYTGTRQTVLEAKRTSDQNKATQLEQQKKQAEVNKKKEFETNLTVKINSLMSEEKFNIALKVLENSKSKVSESYYKETREGIIKGQRTYIAQKKEKDRQEQQVNESKKEIADLINSHKFSEAREKLAGIKQLIPEQLYNAVSKKIESIEKSRQKQIEEQTAEKTAISEKQARFVQKQKEKIEELVKKDRYTNALEMLETLNGKIKPEDYSELKNRIIEGRKNYLAEKNKPKKTPSEEKTAPKPQPKTEQEEIAELERAAIKKMTDAGLYKAPEKNQNEPKPAEVAKPKPALIVEKKRKKKSKHTEE